jgi:HrpA-like RNA helicase
MSLTLLQKGFIVPPKNASDHEKTILSNTIGIDYIIKFLSDRMYEADEILIPPSRLGDKILLLKSDTGSGKSTVLPAYLYKHFIAEGSGNIYVSQPRVINAIDIATQMPEYNSFLKLDYNIGYTTGLHKRLPLNNGIVYMTTGILLAQIKSLSHAEFTQGVKFIIIDEVHERSIEIDFLLFFIKSLLFYKWGEKTCPMIIIMSATFDENIFIDYFDIPVDNYIEIKGKIFPIELNYSKYDISDFVKYSLYLTEKIHIENLAELENEEVLRDIIIFVENGPTARSIIKLLHEFNATTMDKNNSEEDLGKYITNIHEDIISPKSSDNYSYNKRQHTSRGGLKDEGVKINTRHYILPLELTSETFSGSGDEYKLIYSNVKHVRLPIYQTDGSGKISKNAEELVVKKYVTPSRRVIIATNVAETGITINTLKYCIDTGWVFTNSFIGDFGSKILLSTNVTQNMAMQRRGRVGRKGPGVWYGCYTEELFNLFTINKLPDIITNDVSDLLLTVFVKNTSSLISKEENKKNTQNKIYDSFGRLLFHIKYLIADKTDKFKLISYFNINFSTMDYIIMPASSALTYYIEKLYGLGLINSLYKPTIFGFYADKMNKITIEQRRMILSGYSHGANILDLITITAFLFYHRQTFKKNQIINIFNTDDSNEFYNRVLFSDNFLQYLFIWDKITTYTKTLYKKFLNKQEYRTVSDFKKWCIDNNIIFSGLSRVIKLRNDIIENFIYIGLDPYYNGLNINKKYYNIVNIIRNDINSGTAEIKKIKKCILDGYRFNLLKYNVNKSQYETVHTHVPVSLNNPIICLMGEMAEQKNPNYIISAEIMINKIMKNPGVFEFTSNNVISVLDGYIDIDINFLKQ